MPAFVASVSAHVSKRHVIRRMRISRKRRSHDLSQGRAIAVDKLDEREMLDASRAKRTIGKAVAMSADDPEADLVLVSERTRPRFGVVGKCDWICSTASCYVMR
jgi:hypothetical protein